ncbi:MAG TPA: hypothetical protein VML00_10300 [Bacteroidota bacterium]|nr:hypothetical protein [Bacteroidota bacterium]
MTRLRCAAALLVAALYALPARSQAVLPERGRDGGLRENVYGLGLSVGAASGIGLSFRHHLPGYFSYQLIGGIIKVDNRTLYAIGGEFQYDFIRGSGVRFFAAGATGFYYAGRGHGNEIDGPGRLGAGIGAEVPVQGGFHLSGELLFTYFSDGNVLPLPQLAMHYYFY